MLCFLLHYDSQDVSVIFGFSIIGKFFRLAILHRYENVRKSPAEMVHTGRNFCQMFYCLKGDAIMGVIIS